MQKQSFLLHLSNYNTIGKYNNYINCQSGVCKRLLLNVLSHSVYEYIRMRCYLLAHDQPKQTHESYFISWIIPRFSSFHTVQAMDTKVAVAWLESKRLKDSQEVSRRRPLCEWTRRLMQNYVWYFLGWDFWNRRKVWEKTIWQDIKVNISILHFKSETVSVFERCNIYVKTEQKY